MKSTIIRFGELYDIPSSNGLSRPSSVRGVGYKMINMGELFANDIISDIDMERVLMSDKEKEKFLVNQGDLLFARQSLVASGAGKCSIVKDVKEPTTFESHLIRVRLNQDKANPWFYYYLFKLQNNPIKGIVNQCAQAGIRGNELLKVKVPYIAKTEQDKIVDVLYDYDYLIENNNKRIKILEQMAENLYKEWFVRFRFPGHEDVEFEGGIPKGWETGRIGDIVEFLNGFAFKSEDFIEDGKYKIITIKSVKDEGFDDSGADTIDDIPQRMPKHCYLNDGDVLISLTGNVGRVCLAYGDNNLLNQRVAKFKTAFPMFAYCMFKTEYMQIMLNNLANGTAQLNLSPVKTARLKILIPEKDIINQFENHVKAIFEEILKLKYENINLQKQRDLLLPRLMSGKLEVK